MTTDGSTPAGEARSVRHWLRRTALPLLIRYLVIIILVVLLFGVWRLWSANEIVNYFFD